MLVYLSLRSRCCDISSPSLQGFVLRSSPGRNIWLRYINWIRLIDSKLFVRAPTLIFLALLWFVFFRLWALLINLRLLLGLSRGLPIRFRFPFIPRFLRRLALKYVSRILFFGAVQIRSSRSASLMIGGLLAHRCIILHVFVLGVPRMKHCLLLSQFNFLIKLLHLFQLHFFDKFVCQHLQSLCFGWLLSSWHIQQGLARSCSINDDFPKFIGQLILTKRLMRSLGTPLHLLARLKLKCFNIATSMLSVVLAQIWKCRLT